MKPRPGLRLALALCAAAAGADEASQAPTDSEPAAATPKCAAGDCAPPSQCVTSSSCDPAVGCVYENQTDGTECDDGLSYTHGDVCRQGECAGAAMLNLTDDDFDATVDNEELVLVWFYKENCLKCSDQQRWMEGHARNLSQREHPIKVVCVNTETAPRAAARGVVTDPPKVRLFHSGEPLTEVSLSLWSTTSALSKVLSWVGPSTAELSTAAEVKAKADKKTLQAPIVVGLFTKGATQGALDFRIFTQAAHFFRGQIQFYHVTAINALTDLGHLGRGGAVMGYRPWEQKKFRVMYKGKLFKQAVIDWVSDNLIPPVAVINRERLDMYKGLKRPLLRAWYWGLKEADEQRKKLNAELLPIALKALEAKERDKRLATVIEDGTDFVHNVMSKSDYGFTDDDIRSGRAVAIEESQRAKPISFKYEPVHGTLGEWFAKWQQRKLAKWRKRCFLVNATGATLRSVLPSASCTMGGYVNHGDVCEWIAEEGYSCSGAGRVLCSDGAWNATISCTKGTEAPAPPEDEDAAGGAEGEEE